MSRQIDDAAVADVVEAAILDERRRGDALKGPVVGAAGLELHVRLLPEELAVRFAERHEHAAVAGLLRVAQQLVVRADEHHAAGDDRIAVALRSEVGDPLDVLLRLDVPLGRQPLHVGHHVAVGRAAPHGPVAGAGVRGRERRRGVRSTPKQRSADWPLRAAKTPVRVDGGYAWSIRSWSGRNYRDTHRTARRGTGPAHPARLPIGSVLSINHALGSASPTAHAFPRARTCPFGRFSTRSFRRYHVSGFHANGTVMVRAVSGSHGSIFSRCEVPYSTSEYRCAVIPTSPIWRRLVAARTSASNV